MRVVCAKVIGVMAPANRSSMTMRVVALIDQEKNKRPTHSLLALTIKINALLIIPQVIPRLSFKIGYL